jgi:DeoR/GlpR family transcriptional regulator of sugar metabolism
MTTCPVEQFTLQRRFDILRILEQEQRATVSELKTRFAVSEVTIRKDLAWLVARRLIIRSYGGALWNKGNEDTTRTTPISPLNQARSQTREKAIGMVAAALVQDGETIAIDSSPFAHYLVRGLGNFKELTIITYNLDCALELKGRSGISVLLPGGRIYSGIFSANLIAEENFFTQFHIQRLFVGAKGLDLKYGLSEENGRELALKKGMVKEAKEVVAFIDHTGWDWDRGQGGLFTFCPIERVKTIISPKEVPVTLISQARKRGIEVLLV